MGIKVVMDKTGVRIETGSGKVVGGNGKVVDLSTGEETVYIAGVKQVTMDPKFFSAMAAGMTDTMGDEADWMKNHISGAMGDERGSSFDFKSMFDGKEMLHADGSKDTYDFGGGGFDSNFRMEAGAGGGMNTWESDFTFGGARLFTSGSIKMAAKMGAGNNTLTCEGKLNTLSGHIQMGDATNQNGHNCIQLYMSGGSAGDPPLGASSPLNQNPAAGSVLLFTDGTDVYVKTSNGTVKRVFTQG